MSLSGVASRFSVLPDDDATDWSAPKAKKGSKAKADTSLKTQPQPGKKKAGKKNDDVDDLRSAAFGGKPKTAKKAKGKQGAAASAGKVSEQFQEWKEKDVKHVEDLYSTELKEALIQSKVDFEEQQKSRNVTGENGDGETPRKKKTNTLSLNAFNNLQPTQIDNFNSGSTHLNGGRVTTTESLGAEQEEDFFQQVDEVRDKVLGREQRMDALKNTVAPLRESPDKNSSNNAINLTTLTQQFKRDISLKDIEIQLLKREKDELALSLAATKSKCRKLLLLMGQGEEKEKVELLVENDKLKSVRGELTEEISRLSGDLEQEKSKSQELAKELRRLQGKRVSSSTTSKQD